MENSERFLVAYNKIVDLVKKILRVNENELKKSFRTYIDDAIKINKSLNYYKSDLIKYHDLRNVIVHEKYDDKVIAEPIDWVVREIEKIANLLTDPPKITVLLKGKPPIFELIDNDFLLLALKEMSEKKYSQIPIYTQDEKKDLLTSDLITEWLGKVNLEKLIDIENIKIDEILDPNNRQEKFLFINKNASILDVKNKFLDAAEKGKRLIAILITENGKEKEKIINILTIEDLPLIEKIIHKDC